MDLMDKLVALCKRRGFIFPSSDIYGGLNGCWDYGPLGVELKRNIKQAWWEDMIARHDDTLAPAGCAGRVLDGGPRQRAADESESVGSQRARRRLQRSDGRLSPDAGPLPRRSARRLSGAGRGPGRVG
jgi:hypothetical protein